MTSSTLVLSTTGAKPPLVPVPLALPLMKFQEKALAHALRENGEIGYSYIGLEMGLGKTPVAIAILAAAAAVGATPNLVVVPASLRLNWLHELRKFAPWLTVEILQGTRPPEGVASLPDADVLIIGNASIAPAKETVKEKNAGIKPIGWYDLIVGHISGFVVDEAHFFKNKSGRTKSMKAIADATPGLRILMSGTPTPNGRHVELASQVDLMGKSAWQDIGGEGKFWQYYAPKQDKYGARGSVDTEGLYSAMSGSWYTRELRSNVLKMPPKDRKIYGMEGRGVAKRGYLRAEEDLIGWLREQGRDTMGAARAEALVRLTTMRQLAGQSKIPAVVDHVLEILRDEKGGVFVVAEHRAVMDGLMLGLAPYNPATIEGGMNDAVRHANVEAFCTGKTRLLIGQIQAAGVGLTLHGNGRNHREVVTQLPWTPAALMQVEDRLHRIGQVNDVDIDICLATIEGSWTIDERLWNMLEHKAFNASSISDGVGSFLLSEAVEGLLDTYRQ